MQRNTRAFTLIELLIVVLIIGILAAVALPQYQLAVAKSRLATIKHLVTSIKEAQEIYYLANGSYATKFEDLDIDLPGEGELNDDGNIYTYTWGYCVLGITASSCRAENRLAYQMYFSHSGFPSRINCMAIENDLVAHRACQAETGQTMPAWTGDSLGSVWSSYRYSE